MKAVQKGYVPMETDANGAPLLMSLDPEVVSPVAGTVFVYLTNESNTEVYFDDFEVTIAESMVVQNTDYYPFGLTFDSWTRVTDLKNNFLYNAGSELNEHTKNYETFYRDYDPALGRMTGIDPMAVKYASATPYNYAFNDPVGLNDPLGDDVIDSGPIYMYGRLMNPRGVWGSRSWEGSYLDAYFFNNAVEGYVNMDGISYKGRALSSYDWDKSGRRGTYTKKVTHNYHGEDYHEMNNIEAAGFDVTYTFNPIELIDIDMDGLYSELELNSNSGNLNRLGAVSRTVGSGSVLIGAATSDAKGAIYLRNLKLWSTTEKSFNNPNVAKALMDLSQNADEALYTTKFLKGATLAKIANFGKVAGPLASIAGMGVSGYKILNGQGTGMDWADIGVNAIGLGAEAAVVAGLISNPVGWVIGAGVLIYNGYRLYQSYTDD